MIMKRYMITMASVLMTLTSFAQSLVVVEREGSNDEFIYDNSLEISFWGQPVGEEQNGDLTITPTEVTGHSVSFVFKASNTNLLTDFGFYISEVADEWKEEDATYVHERPYDGYDHYSSEAKYEEGKNRYSLRSVDLDRNNQNSITVTGLAPHTTYYIKPYALVAGETIFGSEKSFTTLWTLDAILADQKVFGDWYENTSILRAIVPTAEAWKALCVKYKDIFGDEPSEVVKKVITTEWGRHLTVAEADMMKAHTVAYYDNCEYYYYDDNNRYYGDVYVVDKVCDEMIPNLLKASGDIDLRYPNMQSRGETMLYTKNCEPIMVGCPSSYGITSYVKAGPVTQASNPQIGYDFPFTLLPNRIYNVSVTIAPNTEDPEDVRPNKFNVNIYNEGSTTPTRIANPQTTTEDKIDNEFIYGGSKLETFTFQIDTHQSELVAPRILQFSSSILSKQRTIYSTTMRIAKITVSPKMEDVVPGDADMDGIINQDDVQTVASVVVLSEGKTSDTEEKPATDFTGDGKTLIDDVVALVNYIQTGDFIPVSTRARARYAAAMAPEFTTEKNLNIIAGENTTMSVDVSGIANYTAASFDIKVPQGVRIAIDESGKPKVAFGDVATAKHNLKAAMQEDGKTISVACYADDNACFTKGSGSIITVALTADYETEPTENTQITLANCMMTKPNVTSVMLDDYLINVGIVNSVDEVESSNTTPDSYYTIDGIPLSAPQKGLNLVKMKDGSVKKVFIQ